MPNIILDEIRLNRHEVKLIRTLENLEIQKNLENSLGGGDLWWPSLINKIYHVVSHFGSHKQNGYHGSTVQDRDLQQNPTTTIFGSIFNLNMKCKMT